MRLITMVTIKHTTSTNSLLSQLYFCQDPNVSLMEEVIWLGLELLQAAPKLTIIPRSSLQHEYPSSFFFLPVSSQTRRFGETRRDGRTDGLWQLYSIYIYRRTERQPDGWMDWQRDNVKKLKSANVSEELASTFGVTLCSCFVAWFTRLWRWKLYVPPKHRQTSTY
jgi:hypothetical protein